MKLFTRTSTRITNQSRSLKDNRGFTLVEVLVMLAVIGLITGVLFGVMGNVFGDSSTKAAAIQISDGIRQISDGAQNYQAQKSMQAANPGTLITAGLLNSMPPVPSAVGTTWAAAWGTDASRSGKKLMTLSVTNDAVCQKVNELFAGLAAGATIVALNDVSLAGKDLVCAGATGAGILYKTIY
jgi:prepilin-type N-terminal cleavage/methylation domain-containing protein